MAHNSTSQATASPKINKAQRIVAGKMDKDQLDRAQQINLTEAAQSAAVAPPMACPVLTTLTVIGGKWKPAILWALQNYDVLRFGELKRQVAGITQKMLTQQLRELEADGIVQRKVYAEVPPRVEYQLTDYGRTVTPILDEMAYWGLKHQAK